MTKQTTNRPTHRAYITTGDGEHKRWHELGPVWSHADGKGFNLMPHVLPAAGQTIVVRALSDHESDTPEQAGQ